MMEVLGVVTGIVKTVLEGMQDDVVSGDSAGNVGRGGVGYDGLWQPIQSFAEGCAGEEGVALFVVGEGWVVAVEELLSTMHQFECRLLAHAIENSVGTAVKKDAGA